MYIRDNRGTKERVRFIFIDSKGKEKWENISI